MKYYSLGFFVLLVSIAQAANPTTPAVPVHAAPPQVEPLQAGEQLLWDYWYTATIQKKHKYGYYNDRVVKMSDKIRFKNQFWKMEEGFINEEQLSSIASDNENLTPILFNFRSNYRSTITNIDGTASGGLLTIKVRQADRDLEPISKGLPSTLFTSALFPVWLGRHLAQMQPKKTLNFLTLMEDGTANNFSTVSGSATLLPSDSIASSTHTQKVEVSLSDQKTTWYVDKQGAPVKIVMPGQNLEIDRVAKEQALRFFK